ncbi:hypothetical protein CL618_03385 [archaeon]|nr:hypothetical protein [archaeon]|tara:strand:- start:2058 stop:2387 length:330 start_codon:yes stop_codon:yes gene_type:complete
MGIKVEFNPDLALRNIDCGRSLEECIPRRLEEGRVYEFLKKGQRNYWLEGEIPLIETDGSELSMPLASITILNVVHFLKDREVYTKGSYVVEKVLEEGEVYFNGFGVVE